MEQREAAQAALDAVVERLTAARDQRLALEAERDQVLAEIAKDEEWKNSARRPLAADLPADLIALYDKVRESSGGIGAAAVALRPVRWLPAGAVRRRALPGQVGATGRGSPLRRVPADHGTYRGVRSVMADRVIVEADGGARGNPGPAGYGAVVRDADTGEVLAERSATLGSPPTTWPSTPA